MTLLHGEMDNDQQASQQFKWALMYSHVCSIIRYQLYTGVAILDLQT